MDYIAIDNSDLDYESPIYDIMNANQKLDMLLDGYAAPTSEVISIALVDRYYNWYEGGVDTGNHNARIYQASYQSLVQISDCGELDTGDPQTLADFVIWAASTYPANKYSLTIFDHGNGWQGLCNDQHRDQPVPVPKSSIDMGELKNALATAESTVGFKLDVIAFDACLMQNTEVAYQIRDYAKVMVGSEEIGCIGCIDFILGRLTATPSVDAFGLGAIYVEEAGMQHNTGQPVTLSAIDLSKVGTVVTNLQKFATYLTGYLKDPDPAKAQGYRAAIEDCRAHVCHFEYEVDDFVDLYDFTNLCYACSQSGLLPNTKGFVQSMTTIKSTVLSMTIAEHHNVLEPYYEHAYSISIYCPNVTSDWSSNKASYAIIDMSLSAAAPAWGAFLEVYFAPSASPPGVPQSLTSWASPASQGKYIVLNWLAPLSDGGSPITQYIILRSTRSGAERQFATVSGTSLSYTDFSVKVGITYYYKVQAVNAVGPGPLSAETWNTVQDPRP